MQKINSISKLEVIASKMHGAEYLHIKADTTLGVKLNPEI